MNWSKFFLQVSIEFKFFLLRDFIGMEISINPKVERSTANIVGHPSQAITISDGFTNRHEIWHCPDRRWYPSSWPISDLFSLISAFN